MIRNIALSLSIVMAILLPGVVRAMDITTTAGHLSAAVGDNTEITSLTVSGSLNAADFDFIGSKLTNLTSLDLGAATIEAYTGDKVLAGRGQFPVNEMPAYALFGSKVSTLTLPATITAIGTSAFAASALTEVTIPATVTSIGDHAFNACASLTEVTVPATVKTLGLGVFTGCTALTDAVMLADINTLPAGTFAGCSALKSLTVSNSLTAIGDEALKGCRALKSFDMPLSVATIGEKSFYASGLTDIDLRANKSLKSIGDYAYALCDQLVRAVLPDHEIELGDGIFFDDTILRNVTLPTSTTYIPSFTFKGDKKISADNLLPDCVATIGNYALMGWENVQSFTLPEKLASLGDGAMENWAALDTIHADKLTAVPQLGDNVWLGINQPDVILYVDADMFESFNSANQWSDFSVRVKTSSVDNLITIDPSAQSAVTFELLADRLVIRSSGEPVVNVAIYDLNGRQRLMQSASAQAVSIAIDRLPSTVFIVNVRLADDSVANLKVSK